MLPAAFRKITVRSGRRTQLLEITDAVQDMIRAAECKSGVCHLYVPHTTAGVIVNEADDPAVARDIEHAFDALVPRSSKYEHAEGNADSHIKTALSGSSATLLVEDGGIALGRWQGVFFCEFDGPREREVWVKIVADAA